MMNFLGNVGKLIVENTAVVRNVTDAAVNAVSTVLQSTSSPIVVVTAQELQKRQFVLVKSDGAVFLYKQVNSGGEVQVCVKSKSGKFFSVFRDKNVGTAGEEKFKKFVEETFLLSLFENDELFKKCLEEICRNPEWKNIHYACSIGLENFFVYLAGDPNVFEIINSPALPDGIFPLHIAIQNGHSAIVSRLVGIEADVSTVDLRGNNSFHYAASSDEQILKILSSSPKRLECINNENSEGVTPLFLSIQKLKPDCVRALLDAGASPLVQCHGKPLLLYLLSTGHANPKYQECLLTLLKKSPGIINDMDVNTGDTVLHTVIDGQILNLMLKCGGKLLNINTRNTLGDTPLMSHLKRANFNCVVSLLSYGAEMEVRDSQANTCLHVAVLRGYLDFVKLLIIFGADTSATNQNGETVLHVAAANNSVPARKEILKCLEIAGVALCAGGRKGCNENCQRRHILLSPGTDDLNEFAQKLAVEKSLSKKREGKPMDNVLALDGGGIRGLILLQILLLIEKRLNNMSLLSKFQWIAGTSTGAIVAAALCAGRTLRECQQLYFRFKDEVFGSGSRPYNTKILEDFLKYELGENVTMGGHFSKEQKLIITTVDGTTLPLKLHMFRSYQLPDVSAKDNINMGYVDPATVALWKAARCSSAAPTYFDSFDGKFVDGGLVANNPTLDLFTEIHSYNTALKFHNKADKIREIGLVLSVGTGRTPKTATSLANISRPSNIMEGVWAAFTAKDLAAMLIEQVTESDGRPVDRARGVFNDKEVPYFRFSTPLQKEVVLDETKNEVLVDALWQTMEFMHSCEKEVSDVVKLL